MSYPALARARATPSAYHLHRATARSGGAQPRMRKRRCFGVRHRSCSGRAVPRGAVVGRSRGYHLKPGLDPSPCIRICATVSGPIPARLPAQRGMPVPLPACVGSDRAAASSALAAGAPVAGGSAGVPSRGASSAPDGSAKTWAQAHEDPKLWSPRAVLGTVADSLDQPVRVGPASRHPHRGFGIEGRASGVVLCEMILTQCFASGARGRSWRDGGQGTTSDQSRPASGIQIEESSGEALVERTR